MLLAIIETPPAPGGSRETPPAPGGSREAPPAPGGSRSPPSRARASTRGRRLARGRAVRPVRPRLRDEVARAMERLERPGVRPPAVQQLAGELAALQVPVVHVGDLELAARRGAERPDDVEHAVIVHVNAGHRIVALRARRLLLDRRDAAVADLRDAEPPRVGDLLQDDPGAARLPREALDRRRDRPLDQVVAEEDAQAVAFREGLCEGERSGDPALAFLVRVVEMREAELAPVPEEAQEVARVRPAGHEEDVADAGVDERLERIEDHRAVEDRQQVLVRDAREREETRAEPAREQNALHLRRSRPSPDRCPDGGSRAG